MNIESVPFQLTSVAAVVALLTTFLALDETRAQAVPVLPAAPAAAASAAADASVTPVGTGKPVAQFQNVVVTADRRAENIKRVPSSMTAIGSDKLESIGAARIDDFVALVPGLNFVGSRPGDRQLILRGISTGGDQQSATVGTYIDDVPVGSSNSNALGARAKPDIDAFDLERIEVLRGPQGTLYGASTLGGLIKYVTAAPDPASFQGFGRIEYMSASGGGQGYGGNAGFNAPLSTTSAIRVSVFDRKEPGYIDNVDPVIGRKNANDLRSTGIRLAYAAKPLDSLDVRASIISQRLKTGAESTEDINPSTGQPIVGENLQNRATPEDAKQNFDLYSLSLELDLAGGKLLSVTSFNRTRFKQGIDWTQVDGSGFNDPSVLFAHEVITPETKKTTQEFRYTSQRSDTLEWMAGVFWTRERSSLGDNEIGLLDRNTVAPPPNDNFFSYDLDSTYTQKAAYGNVRYYLSKSFDVAAGLRYTHDNATTSTSEGGLFGSGSSFILPQSSSYTSFMLAPRYLIDRDSMVYARAASASRPGGVNGLAPAAVAAGASSSFAPDKLTSYELGYKTAMLDNKLGLDVALFYIDWKSIQLRSTVTNFSFIANGGAAKSQGVEATVSYQPIESLNLGLNGAYTDAKLKQDAPGVGALAGDRLPNAPKLTAALTVDYEFAGLSGGRSYAGATVRHVGDRLENFILNQSRDRLVLPSYNTLDLRTGIRWVNWDINLYVKNATNQHIIETYTTNFTPATATIGRPRTIGVYASFRTF